MSVTPELRCEVYAKTKQYDRIVDEGLACYVTKELFGLIVADDHDRLVEAIASVADDKWFEDYDRYLMNYMGPKTTKAMTKYAHRVYATTRAKIINSGAVVNAVVKITRGVGVCSDWHEKTPTLRMTVHEDFTHLYGPSVDVVTIFPLDFTREKYAAIVANEKKVPADFYDEKFTKDVYEIRLSERRFCDDDAPDVMKVMGEEGVMRLAAMYKGHVPKSILDVLTK